MAGIQISGHGILQEEALKLFVFAGIQMNQCHTIQSRGASDGANQVESRLDVELKESIKSFHKTCCLIYLNTEVSKELLFFIYQVGVFKQHPLFCIGVNSKNDELGEANEHYQSFKKERIPGRGMQA